MRFFFFLLVAIERILYQTNVTLNTFIDACNLLCKVLESVKGLIGFSSFPLLHLPFGNLCHLQKEPALWTNQIIQLCWHQNNRKVRFLYLEQVRNFRVKQVYPKSLTLAPALCHHQQEPTKPDAQTNTSNGAACWQAEPARALGTVMILDVEGRLDGRQVIWGGFSNHVRLEETMEHSRWMKRVVVSNIIFSSSFMT